MKKKYIIILILVLFVALVGVVSLNRSSFSLPKNEINEEVINDEPLTNPDVLNDDYEGPQENEFVQDNNKDNHEQKNSDSSDSNKTSTVDTKKTEKTSEKEEKKPDEAIKEPTTKPAIEKNKDSNTEQNISPAIDNKESTVIETVPAIVETTSAIEVNTSDDIKASEPAINIDSPIENEEPKIEPENKKDTETTPTAVQQELPVIPKNDQTPSNEKTEARVQYVMKINPELSLDEAQLIVNEFELFANTRDYLDVEVLMSISRLESGFKPHIGTNYFGLMQVSGKYGNIAGYTNEQLLTPHYNIEYACSILDDCYKKLDGNLVYTLMGYNQGYYGLKAKLNAGTELNFAFVERCVRYINEITAMYPQQ